MKLEERSACPMCGFAETRSIYACRFDREPLLGFLTLAYPLTVLEARTALSHAEFRLDECSRCRGIFQRYAGDAEFQERLYSRWVRPAEAHGGQQTHHVKYYLRRAQEVVSLLTHFQRRQAAAKSDWSPRDLKVLDYGMGWGEFCQMAKSFGCDAWGYDISAPVLERARKQGLQVVSDFESNTEQFDVINAEQVFEHLVDPLATLELLKRQLSPGGVIRICVPSGRHIHARLKGESLRFEQHAKRSLFAVWPLEHVNCFSADSLAEMGRAAGLVPFQIADGLPIGIKGTLKEAVRPLLELLGIRVKNVCYYRLPGAEQIRPLASRRADASQRGLRAA